VQDVFQKFELRAEAKQITMAAKFPPRLPAALADLGMIERVLSNLLDNALRHTPEGGRIEVGIAASGEGLEVMVSDTGPGIPDALREALFQRPFTVGGARRSGGLGLRIVHRILELHGRRIRLNNAPGLGASFCFSVPAAREHPSAG
jgi:signal transduction histidine kinase